MYKWLLLFSLIFVLAVGCINSKENANNSVPAVQENAAINNTSQQNFAAPDPGTPSSTAPILEFRIENPGGPRTKIGPNGEVTPIENSQWLRTGLSSKQLTRAYAGQADYAQVVVYLEFNYEGKILLNKITTDNIGKRLAIFVDSEIISAPTIQGPIPDGIAIITGNFTTEQAKSMANHLNSSIASTN